MLIFLRKHLVKCNFNLSKISVEILSTNKIFNKKMIELD